MSLLKPKGQTVTLPVPDDTPVVNVEALEIAQTFQSLLEYAGKVSELQAGGLTKAQIAAGLAAEPEPLIQALHFGVMSYGIIGMMKAKIQDLQRQLDEANALVSGGGLLKLTRSLEAKGIDMEAVKKAEAENEAFERRRQEELEADGGGGL